MKARFAHYAKDFSRLDFVLFRTSRAMPSFSFTNSHLQFILAGGRLWASTLIRRTRRGIACAA